MDFSSANAGLWNPIVQIGIIAGLILLANTLRQKIAIIRNSLMPTAVLAGFILLILRTFNIIEVNPSYLESITYHAIALGFITLGTLLYTVNKSRIKTLTTSNKLVCVAIGLVLGIMSSFLGIGGGPINLVVLGFFFSMDTKTAAANSLYIILFSQMANLLTIFVTASVPEFRVPALILMVAGGIGGGIVGRKLNRKMDNKAVDKLFIGLMVLIVCICVYNAVRAFT